MAFTWNVRKSNRVHTFLNKKKGWTGLKKKLFSFGWGFYFILLFINTRWQSCFLNCLCNMEDYVMSKLNMKLMKKVGSDSGCINNASIYETEGGKIFIKHNSDAGASIMFKGEFESLKELSRTQTLRVPKPLFVGNVGKKCFIVMEYLNMRSLLRGSSRLGTLLAEMHLHNLKKLKQREKSHFVKSHHHSAVDRFGFHVPTACGYIPQVNEWSDDWVDFYAKQKLQQQVELILVKDGNREINELWMQLQVKIPSFFKGIKIEPSLLHGDLWIGNTGETSNEPVVFDPASFYGHHEYDLAIAAMFYGFDKTFFDSYHKLLPKDVGFEKRHKLYLLFHHLNHWNHFGSHKESSLKIMRDLLKQS